MKFAKNAQQPMYFTLRAIETHARLALRASSKREFKAGASVCDTQSHRPITRRAHRRWQQRLTADRKGDASEQERRGRKKPGTLELGSPMHLTDFRLVRTPAVECNVNE